MKNDILRRFRLLNEKETPELVHDAIAKAVPFHGTNLWILIFAIIIASLGLNVNSTAVVIGAMLISPLMGPIMGIGYSLSIHDLPLLKKSLTNYAFAGLVGLAASTVYFLLSPIHEAHSEILSRTQPNLYDVLIAFFGGLAGILASCSKQKGNVIPGVAIATALMPPLCTAGYGLATWNMYYLFGALYLYIINSVFISVAAYVTVRYLNLPYRQFPDESEKAKTKRIVSIITLITLIPSVYFAYILIQKNRFESSAEEFYRTEILGKRGFDSKPTINASKKEMIVNYYGLKKEDSVKKIVDEWTEQFKKRINEKEATITIKGKLDGPPIDDLVKVNPLEIDLDNLRKEYALIQNDYKKLSDSLEQEQELTKEVFNVLKTFYTDIESGYIQRANYYPETSIIDSSSTVNDTIVGPRAKKEFLVHLKFKRNPTKAIRNSIETFLEDKFEGAKISLYIER